MTYLRFLLLAYGLLAIFISGGLFFQKSGYTYTFLSIFILLLGLDMLLFLYGTSALAHIYPQFYGRFYFVSGFCYGPVLYFHFRALLKDRQIRAYDLLHFLPLLVALGYYADIWILPDIARILYIQQHFVDRLMPVNYAIAIHILVYGIVFIVMIRKNYKLLDGRKKLYAVAICTIYFATAVLISWLTEYAASWRQFIVYYVVAFSIVFITGFILYREPRFLEQIARKYLSSSLSESDMKCIEIKMREQIERYQVFLQRDLTILKLGEIIKEKPHNISQTLSERINESFNDYINRHRITYAKNMLLSKEFTHYKIEAIAIESGFNNKVTFNKAFAKFTSQTPSSYRNQK
ncbi:transcriptional regulator (AraC family) protein [Fulvivirga imtechensis AK7]|uniref:Transcriptional regulator (AraC family) protein n=1 Tax=Fulvivirga imtechensis AK7 TaxID=1237149 RepID=L8JV93_9BACT|nr:helix-turn-helix domain-containing protein [Fulvivirga imtechensis]ELR72951.1 transcriptional regulator (AraC family) protein [Fulvivirga imtechensis AK7]